MRRILTALLSVVAVCAFLTACNAAQQKEKEEATEAVAQPTVQISSVANETVQPTDADRGSETPPQDEADQTRAKDTELQMTINDTPVTVEWEDNESVQALKELCREQTLTINMSMYGGFEQVGSIGAALPQNDEQTTTSPGDIVLYSGDQMVVFYGSNSWTYTRLGHITDQSESDMTQLLANGDTTVTVGLR